MNRLTVIVLCVAGALASCSKQSDSAGTEPADSLSVKSDSTAADTTAMASEYNFFLDENEEPVYSEAEVPAQFPGGPAGIADFVKEEVAYPRKSLENRAQGTVMVSFVVAENGAVENVKVVSPVKDELLNAEAARVVRNMPDWTPGEIDGETIRMQYIIPIAFSR